jgi:radical SAM superfamily enzyme YgiQ (UPF0313 family)
MKALLISPKGSVSSNKNFLELWNNNPIIKPYRNAFSGQSIGLLILAKLMEEDFFVDLVDENTEEINFDDKYDLIAISFMTQQANRAYAIAKRFRKKGITVIVGGIHPTILSDEAKLYADSVFIGEVENTWSDFMEDFKKGNIKPFYRSKSPCDLNYTPVPAYELLKTDMCKVVWVQTTRGCPHKCEFCVSSNIFGQKYRHKKVEQVVEEIIKIKNIWKKPILISFADDNMFVDHKYARELLHAITPLKIRWFAQTDISVAKDDKILRLIQKSGCSVLFIGFETLNKNGLKLIDHTHWKAKQLVNYSKYIQKIQSHGIGVMGAFIMGLDSDTKNNFNQMKKFIINNHLYASQVTLLTPFPGTKLRERLLAEGRVLTSDWSKYTNWDVVFKPKYMGIKVLEKSWIDALGYIYNQKVQLANARYFRKIFDKIAT